LFISAFGSQKSFFRGQNIGLYQMNSFAQTERHYRVTSNLDQK